MIQHKRTALLAAGQVQGVGFRPFIYRLAVEGGLSGSVGNTSDGVRIEVQGPPEQVDAFAVRLRRELNLPETLAQAGVDPRSVWRNAEQIVKAALEDPCCKTNPMEVEDFLVRRILEEVTGRV